jgi:hypothetical protein
MIRNRTPRIKTLIVVIVAALAGLIATLAVGLFPHPPGPPSDLLLVLVRIQLFVTTFNFVLLLALLWAYVSIYRDLPNKYTRSLILLSLALLLYAVTSNPLVHLLFGFKGPPSTGPFVFIPHLFVGAAISVLFYQSQT